MLGGTSDSALLWRLAAITNRTVSSLSIIVTRGSSAYPHTNVPSLKFAKERTCHPERMSGAFFATNAAEGPAFSPPNTSMNFELRMRLQTPLSGIPEEILQERGRRSAERTASNRL
jgi:hypothetical protein